MTLEVGLDGILRAKGRSHAGDDTGEVILEHHLHSLSRFARLHQDPRCFAYLTKTQSGGDYLCHVYLATSENTVSMNLLRNKRILHTMLGVFAKDLLRVKSTVACFGHT